MEHYNPLLPKDGGPCKFITIGEIMLRLTPPNYGKIRVATDFEASRDQILAGVVALTAAHPIYG